MAFLKLEHVSHLYFSNKTYTKALDDISLSINRGEFISILGSSGCGKSTLLSIIAGIIKQTKGNVLLNNIPLHQSDYVLGYMLQQDYLFPWKRIIDNVLIGLKVQKKVSKKTRQKALKLLDEVGLPHLEDTFPNELSGGMRQRVALVRTLITNPEILLLDEPFSALDYQTKLKLEDLVYRLLKQYHKTAILVTHDIGEAISLSDRIILMDTNPGRISTIIDVPKVLREEKPFLVRRQPSYQQLFDHIWASLNRGSETNGSKET
ncbi:NitT/TauT family transport system ATP-binding protein [Cerasibacillus quisquiliarum]|uniref:Putative ABC transporter ATP-binding protein YtlC n=1 Tax=Cerasibacillus quisquiliarum TaxID=227865 RepID=A0A511V0K9_9BACI|nr:ABC transporter ATP-binding protein [Cerasibacillus quisquiliarum]MBB5147544.1 NitT/TauT family transport system ATP-binding protein [Cerasibacillus quisquiliarum]GEN32409.1 putative ABC transporter ATP-binding protein YtlC [Cerasibacillus quisquiliarum]